MPKRSLKIGDLVILTKQQWHGFTGVVSLPITEESTGHVLVYADGHILGVEVSSEDVVLADESSEGFAQLAYALIKLGSHVIEKRLI